MALTWEHWAVGDRFRINIDGYHSDNGKEGKVEEIRKYSEYNLHLRFDDGTSTDWKDEGDIINLTKGQTTMPKLTAMLKLLLQPDDQTLYKAGFLNGDLKLTQEGREALDAVLLAANKAALVKVAQDKLDEEKSDVK